MARRNEQHQFQQYAPQPNMAPQQQQPPQQQQHHPAPVQPPMNVPQQPPNGPAPPQQTPTPTPAPASRQRKRPAPAAAPPATVAPPAPVTPSQVQPPVAAPPAVQAVIPQPPPQAPTDDANAQAIAPPPAKKSRTNTPWTPQEELRLKQMRDAGNSWAEIAKTFPTRTEGSVKKHWYKDMHYAEFAEDESQALLNAIKEYENNKWKVIGQKVGKPAKSKQACEQYAKEHFPGMATKFRL
ncbi:myb dna-binding domain protein [Fusarium sporotrichioides]|uniref:Myb dna-binding domain protein n=1 Tax=Fusarium sporotrichioides TaxID=5514 RepID=A0A395RNR3_FUSSP|nr:myb dna-binding domain protein [Fusarium sporotrichioides]